MAVRDGHAQPLAARAAAVGARHVGARPGLVDEDEPLGVEVGLAVEPGLPPLQDVGTVLLGGVRGLFLRVMRGRRKKRHSAATPTWCAVLGELLLQLRQVISLVSASAAWMSPACASVRDDRRSPPTALGLASPTFRLSAAQRIALDALTPKRSAA